jgi:hypothetical protein
VELKNLLSSDEIADLQELSKHREWVSLLKLVRKLDDNAIAELLRFSTSEEAFKKQGKVEGIRLLLDTLQSLYTSTRNVASSSQSAIAGVRVVQPRNDGDTEHTKRSAY